jgi:hypothetical protein
LRSSLWMKYGTATVSGRVPHPLKIGSNGCIEAQRMYRSPTVVLAFLFEPEVGGEREWSIVSQKKSRIVLVGSGITTALTTPASY